VHELSNISLRWMVHEVMKSQCGVMFDEQALSRASIPHYNFLIKSVSPIDGRPNLDTADALEPLHDVLKVNVMWWLLEIVPSHYSWQDDKGVWHKEWKCVLSAC
jgi:hypothetical protein